MTVIKESLDFGLLLGQNEEFKRRQFGLWVIVKSIFHFFFHLQITGQNNKQINCQ